MNVILDEFWQHVDGLEDLEAQCQALHTVLVNKGSDLTRALISDPRMTAWCLKNREYVMARRVRQTQ